MKKYKKIVILDSVIIYPEHRYRLNKLADEIVEYNTCKNEKEVLERVKGADCIISCWVNISNRVIDENPQLKTIAFWTHAYEHRIDKKYAEAHGIYVPCIPDYGTDSVAELAIIGMLNVNSRKVPKDKRRIDEELAMQVANSIRNFQKNVKDNLTGHWIHEYVKTGNLKITDPSYFEEETMKGMTVGLLLSQESLNNDLIRILSQGFKMNVIHCCCDIKYTLNASFRPVDNLLKESNIIIYDSKLISPDVKDKILHGKYINAIDIDNVQSKGESLKGKKLGIIGLGRIGTRVAQIATQGFGMKVTYYSRTRKPNIEKEYGIEYDELNNVLSNSEYISFHLPHVGAEDFVTNEMIDLIPKKSTLINVSVGNIFKDQEHLLSRFNKDDLTGYLDVYKTMPPRQELRERQDYLISTFRLGWRTKSTIGLKTHKLITKLGLDNPDVRKDH